MSADFQILFPSTASRGPCTGRCCVCSTWTWDLRRLSFVSLSPFSPEHSCVTHTGHWVGGKRTMTVVSFSKCSGVSFPECSRELLIQRHGRGLLREWHSQRAQWLLRHLCRCISEELGQGSLANGWTKILTEFNDDCQKWWFWKSHLTIKLPLPLSSKNKRERGWVEGGREEWGRGGGSGSLQ